MKRLLRSVINSAEKRMGVPSGLDYMRYMTEHSAAGTFKTMLTWAMAMHHAVLPDEIAATARIVAAQAVDCGECVQIELNQAMANGVSAELLRAVLYRDTDRLSPDVNDVLVFTVAVIENDADLPTYREKMRDAYGEKGIVDLTTAIGAAQLYPMLKRVSGHAQSCSIPQLKLG